MTIRKNSCATGFEWNFLLHSSMGEEGLPYGAFCCSDCRTLRTVIMENLVQRSAYGMEGYGKFRMECRYVKIVQSL